jgi:hypothetical protein
MAAFSAPVDKTGIFQIFDELPYFSWHKKMVLLWYHYVKV